MNLPRCIEQGLTFLAAQQHIDGSFDAYSSASQELFLTTRRQPTAFPTILMLDSLQGIAGSEIMTARAATWVRFQMSAQGSWNYWVADSPHRTIEPYPDDLDDTACAVAALTRHDPALIGGSQLGQLARLLVAAEHRPGGPYNTWLSDWQQHTQWDDVDLAVNANIGYALSLQSVTITGLDQYIQTQLAQRALQSSYYVGQLPVLYFLSRWYRGAGLADLRAAVAQQLSRTDLTMIETILLLSVCCRLELLKHTNELTRRVISSAQNGQWPAAALYIDPVYDGRQHYGGSAALSTALALESLELYRRLPTTPPVKVVTKSPLQPDLRRESATIRSPLLRRQYRALARQVGDGGNQISHPATLLAQSNQWRLPRSLLHHLDMGSLNGWIAYTVYDDFLDGTGRPELLSVAHMALRRSYDHYLQAVPQKPWFATLVRQTFDTMDAANAWEVTRARAVIKPNGTMRLTVLPEYGDYRQLAERSLGHSLATIGVLAERYAEPTQVCITALQSFYSHFLIARQLNDDAHDWEDDLQYGRLTAVVSLLLQDSQLPGTFSIHRELATLRQRFWRQTIDQVAVLINEHCHQASEVLQVCSDHMDVGELQTWLEALQQSTRMALNRRDQTLSFMHAYDLLETK